MDIKGDKGGREVAGNRDLLTSNEFNIISAFSVFLRVLLTSNLYLEVKGSFGDRSSYSSVFFFAMNQCMKQKEVNPFFGNLEKGEELFSL